MLEVKRLRLAREWNQTELAFHAGLAPSVISEIENGKRDPSARTLRKLAGALEVDVADLFPKGQAPLPDFEDERRFAEAFELLERRLERRTRQVEDPEDPHFRDATAAANWLADVEEEADEILQWLAAHSEALVGTWDDLAEVTAIGLTADNPAWHGRRRLSEMNARPDELAARRLEKATAAAEESRERLRELARASGG